MSAILSLSLSLFLSLSLTLTLHRFVPFLKPFTFHNRTLLKVTAYRFLERSTKSLSEVKFVWAGDLYVLLKFVCLLCRKAEWRRYSDDRKQCIWCSSATSINNKVIVIYFGCLYSSAKSPWRDQKVGLVVKPRSKEEVFNLLLYSPPCETMPYPVDAAPLKAGVDRSEAWFLAEIDF